MAAKQLTDTAIKSARVEAGKQLRKLADGGGLHLVITAAGAKLWRIAYTLHGKEKTFSVGAYPDISLADAREERGRVRSLVAKGIDPVEERKQREREKALAQANSFKAVAMQWHGGWKSGKSARHADYVLKRLEADVFSAIGARPIADIKAPELVRMAKSIVARGALDIAKRSLETCGQVFRYAIAHGMAERNPAKDFNPADILPTRKAENFARVDAKELPELLRKIEAYDGRQVTRLAMKLLALTFVRTSELIGARWDEFDMEELRWNIPASRMKMKTPHIVALSTQAVEVLQVLREVSGQSALLFPGERDHEKPMSNNTILKALERMGYKGRMTGHGFRGVASTVLHEQGYAHEHIELQLAHAKRNAVSAAYDHALYLGARARMMQEWGDHLEKLLRGNVVPLRQKAA